MIKSFICNFQHLKRGEKITIQDLPGGATYTIIEDPKKGWQLVDAENASGDTEKKSGFDKGTADDVDYEVKDE